MFTAVTPSQLTVGRLVAGLAVGFSTSLCTVYIGECAPAATRGALTLLRALGVTVGILASYFASLPLTNVGRRLEAHAGDVRGSGDGSFVSDIGWWSRRGGSPSAGATSRERGDASASWASETPTF